MAISTPSVAVVLETSVPGPVPLWIHPGWSRDFPWLVQGTTGRGDGARAFDLALFGDAPSREVLDRWKALGDATGMPSLVHGRQVH
ncbi:MAG: hypothetical protein KY453_07285, partial [Gemmatimonadetes bacterium]|nr:hypothetical protein [Gemmatimonadota bacterium]